MKKVLITGGSGFIGTNLVDAFIANGDSVLNIDSVAPAKKEHVKYWKKVDILDYNGVEEQILSFQPEVLLHMAAVTDLNGTNLKYYDANITGTKNIIDAAAKAKSLKKVVYTSSMYVCKPGFIPSDYNTYTPHTVYGESKVQTELLVKAIGKTFYDWVIIRPTSIWGPWFNAPYIDFFNIVYQGKYVDFKNTCTKTYGYIGNTVYQIMKLVENSGNNGNTFYLGDLPPTQISEWADEISVAMNKGHIKRVPFLVLKSAALVGDVLKKIGIRFPITSFRLSNMTTDNVLPLDNTFQIADNPPFTRLDGVKETLKWMAEFKGYKF